MYLAALPTQASTARSWGRRALPLCEMNVIERIGWDRLLGQGKDLLLLESDVFGQQLAKLGEEVPRHAPLCQTPA